MPRPAELISVITEPRAPLAGAAAQPSVIDENILPAVEAAVVRRRIDLDDLERADYRRVGGDTVEADIRLAVGDENEEIGVGSGPCEVLRPRRAPAKDQSALDGGIERRRVRFPVVVVVDGECADVVPPGRQVRDDVAVLLTGGGREEAEGLLLGVSELERLGDVVGGAAGVEAVGEPRGVEAVGGIGGAAAVYVVG